MTKPKSKASPPAAQPPEAPSAPPSTRRSRPRTTKPKAEPPAPAPAPTPTTKLETLTALLKRKQGANLEELMAATGWQAHSVRGAIAGALRKRFGAKVISEKLEGVRIYRAPTP